MTIRPETKEFVRSLRSGAADRLCVQDYCWAKSVVPIFVLAEDSVWDGWDCFEYAVRDAKKALEDGKSDDEIGAAFEGGLNKDVSRGLRFRAAEKSERPTPADLYSRLGEDEKERVLGLFGVKTSAMLLAGKRNYPPA